jgi:signal transduction histidine kinase
VPYHSIDDPAKLRRILEATLLLEGDLDLPTLLRHIVEEASSMAGARFGALGVLNSEGVALSEFVTVGLTPEEIVDIGPLPRGRGVLGLLIGYPVPLRLAHIGSHPESFGFPPNHPKMTSFLGVPIKVREEVYGNLYLTEKIGAPEFTPDDEALVESLALAAGIAVENARLHQRVQEVAVYEERDRLGRELHDAVIQRLFAVGLSLQSVSGDGSAAPVRDRLVAAVADIDETIKQVRTSIFALGSAKLDKGLRASVLALLRELRPVVGFGVQASFSGPVDSAVPELVSEQLLAVIREAVTNVGRHAAADRATVRIGVDGGRVQLQVIDNGRGIAEGAGGGLGLGLSNMEHRAEKLHGRFGIEIPSSGGTTLTWQVPLGP